MSQSVAVASPQLVAEAETLIRSLAGVTHARVHASGSGIDAIHVEVSHPDRAAHVADHVRSALLAGLATPVTPARIHVRVFDRDAHDDLPPETETAPRHRLRLVHGSADHDARRAQDAYETDPTSPANRMGRAGFEPMPGAQGTPTDQREPAADPDDVTARPRLVAVDLDRERDGRVLCSVTVAYQTDVYRADAVAVDLPGAAAQAAAQATVRALNEAGIRDIELDGLREVEIAGREYVLVALRSSGPYTRVRSGSAPLIGAPERAAALATVDAAGGIT